MQATRSGHRLDLRAQRRDNADSIREDIERYVDAPPELHGRDLEAVCRVVAETLRDRPDRQDVLDFQDRRSPESESFWRRKRSLAKSSTALR